MQLGCKVKISGMSGKDFASRHFPYRQYRRCSSRRFPVADRGNSRVKRYLSLFLHPISEVLDLWQHPEKWKNTELFLYISVSFFPVWRLLCILRYTIQGVGYTNLAMLSGVLEMIARILVSLLAVPAFGYLAVCFGDPTAWIFADAFLIPAFIYVYRRILRMKKNLCKSVLGIYLFEIKRVRRITSFWGNELATVLIAVVCIALLIWVTLYDRKNIKLN